MYWFWPFLLFTVYMAFLISTVKDSTDSSGNPSQAAILSRWGPAIKCREIYPANYICQPFHRLFFAGRQRLIFLIPREICIYKYQFSIRHFFKTTDSKNSFRILIQGPHQSEPEKFSSIYLCSFCAIFSASSRL